jgi:UDP:flavonoid glycosyltransferase YjiC (YdhE family)
MVTIIITSYGTLGDALPFVSLGQALKARGYQVRLALSEPMHPYALKAGLEVVSNGLPLLGQQEAQQHVQDWNHLERAQAGAKAAICHTVWAHLNCSVPCILNTCTDADLLISSPQQNLVAAIAHEKLSIPWISASVTPSLHCHERKSSQSSCANEPATAANTISLQDQVVVGNSQTLGRGYIFALTF